MIIAVVVIAFAAPVPPRLGIEGVPARPWLERAAFAGRDTTPQWLCLQAARTIWRSGCSIHKMMTLYFSAFASLTEPSMRSPLGIVTIASVIVGAGCASIMHGTTQGVGISSSPTNAKVTVDNKPQGTTPVIAELSRKDNHIVKLELDGYQPFEATLTRKTSGWVWGNIVFGGIIGLAVDAMTGGLYNLSPEQIVGQLNAAKTGSMSTPNRGGFYVILVQHADPTWERIGSLSPEISVTTSAPISSK